MCRAEISLQQLSKDLPGLALWKKDLNFNFVDVNYHFSSIFGFKNIAACVGSTDYDLPCKAAECASLFQRLDQEVFSTGKDKKSLDILLLAGGERSIRFTQKSPLYQDSAIIGTVGYSIDITQTFTEASHALVKNKEFIKGSKQASYIIGLEHPNLDLTPEQSRCLFFLIRQKSVKQIASILDLPRKNIELCICQMQKNFDCNTIAQLIDFAIAQGYLNYLPENFFNAQLSVPLSCDY